MEKPVGTVSGALGVQDCSPLPQEPLHEAIWRSLVATYKKEQEKSPSAHTLYNLYEEARVISNQKTLVARRVIQRDLRARLSLPGTLIDDYVRVIDERCASSTHQKVWRRRPNASRMDTMINQALLLAIKRALPRRASSGQPLKYRVPSTHADAEKSKVCHVLIIKKFNTGVNLISVSTMGYKDIYQTLTP